MKHLVKRNISCWILIAVMIVIGISLYACLPDQIAIQWNGQGVSNTAPRIFIFFFPLLAAVLLIYHQRRVQSRESSPNLDHIPLLLCILFLGCQLLIGANAINIFSLSEGIPSLVQTILMLFLGAILVFLGNRMPKIPKNFYCGVKASWAYASDDLWTKTQRFAGKVWLIAGIFLMLMAFIPWNMKSVIIPIVVLATFLLPRLYSQNLYAKSNHLER